MNKTLAFKQTSDLHPALTDPATKTLNAGNLMGRWLNTDPATKGIAEIVIEQDGGQFYVSALGVGSDGPISWPRTQAQALANLDEEAGQRSIVLAATFDFGFMKAETYFRVNKGVMVIGLVNVFQDQSGRSNYINREFYYRPD